MMVFGARWLQLANQFKSTLEDENPAAPALECLLWSYPYEINQRTASLTADFIAWLGSNVGKCYLSEAERLTQWMHAPSAYAAQWALENHRFSGKDEGQRIAELIALDGKPDHKDLEVMEHVAWWLGEAEGKNFVEECLNFSTWGYHEQIVNAFNGAGYAGVNQTLDQLQPFRRAHNP